MRLERTTQLAYFRLMFILLGIWPKYQTYTVATAITVRFTRSVKFLLGQCFQPGPAGYILSSLSGLAAIVHCLVLKAIIPSLVLQAIVPCLVLQAIVPCLVLQPLVPCLVLQAIVPCLVLQAIVPCLILQASSLPGPAVL